MYGVDGRLRVPGHTYVGQGPVCMPQLQQPQRAAWHPEHYQALDPRQAVLCQRPPPAASRALEVTPFPTTASPILPPGLDHHPHHHFRPPPTLITSLNSSTGRCSRSASDARIERSVATSRSTVFRSFRSSVRTRPASMAGGCGGGRGGAGPGEAWGGRRRGRVGFKVVNVLAGRGESEPCWWWWWCRSMGLWRSSCGGSRRCVRASYNV